MQLLALYTDSESHNAQRHRPTDGRTDDVMVPNKYPRLVQFLNSKLQYPLRYRRKHALPAWEMGKPLKIDLKRRQRTSQLIAS